MRRQLFVMVTVLAAGWGALASTEGCGPAGDGFVPRQFGHVDGGSTIDGDIPTDEGGLLFGGDASIDGSGPCKNLQCQQVACPQAGVTTTVSGTVYDPAGAVPLYNAIVYVPNAKLDPFTQGVTCDKCGALQSGQPVSTALTDAKGHFVLQNVPVGNDIPLVVQIGKWRRQTVIPTVAKCQDNPLTDKNLTRLPRNSGEGDIPLTAVSTGSADGLECVLRKMGIDDAEFRGGRIHLYVENGATGGSPGTPAGTSLYNDVNNLKKYDVVVFDCEGSQNDKDPLAQQRVIDYTNAGGRIFASHFSYVWLFNDTPFSGTAQWQPKQSINVGSLTGILDTSFPKGQAFADWLGNVNALSAPGQIAISQPRHDANAVVAPAQRWIYSQNPSSLQHYTFNTPVGVPDDQQCGRVVFSDFHVTSANSGGGASFPSECDNGPLSPQEKVLEFMLFDLASCVQTDLKPPAPPPQVK